MGFSSSLQMDSSLKTGVWAMLLDPPQRPSSAKWAKKKGFKNSSNTEVSNLSYAHNFAQYCKLIFVFNHLVAQSDGCLCKVLPLPLKDLPLLLQSLPLLPEALLLLKHVAIA